MKNTWRNIMENQKYVAAGAAFVALLALSFAMSPTKETASVQRAELFPGLANNSASLDIDTEQCLDLDLRSVSCEFFSVGDPPATQLATQR
jgi:hypothetical protein